MQTPALGLPDSQKVSYLYVSEKQVIVVGVLTQHSGSWQRPVAYLSKQLDTVVQGWSSCLRAIAATALLVVEADKLSLGQETYVRVPHQVQALMDYKGNHWFTNSRMVKYQAMLCENPRIHLETVNTLKPSHSAPHLTRTPTSGQSPGNGYESRPDLKDSPLKNPNVEYFTDGSSFVKDVYPQI